MSFRGFAPPARTLLSSSTVRVDPPEDFILPGESTVQPPGGPLAACNAHASSFASMFPDFFRSAFSRASSALRLRCWTAASGEEMRCLGAKPLAPRSGTWLKKA